MLIFAVTGNAFCMDATALRSEVADARANVGMAVRSSPIRWGIVVRSGAARKKLTPESWLSVRGIASLNAGIEAAHVSHDLILGTCGRHGSSSATAAAAVRHGRSAEATASGRTERDQRLEDSRSHLRLRRSLGASRHPPWRISVRVPSRRAAPTLHRLRRNRRRS